MPTLQDRLEKRFQHITEEAFGLWEVHREADTLQAVPHLSKALTALYEVNGIYQVLPLRDHLLLCLWDEKSATRAFACQAIKKMGASITQDQILDELLKCLSAADVDVRRAACSTFSEIDIPTERQDIITALVRCLWDRKGLVFFSAMVGVRHALRRKEIALEWEDRILDQSLSRMHDWEMVMQNSFLFGQWGLGIQTEREDFLNAWLVPMKSKYEEDHVAAVHVFSELGKQQASDKVRHLLLECLHDKNRFARCGSCRVFGKIGLSGASDEALKGLLLCLQDRYLIVQEASCFALGCLGGISGRRILNALLPRIWDKWRAPSAIVAIGELGKASDTKIKQSVLMSLKLISLAKKDSSTRAEIAAALGKLGPDAADEFVLNELLRGARSRNDALRMAAITALGNLKQVAGKHPGVLDALLKSLKHTNSEVRQEAAEALGKLGELAATPEVFQALLKAFEDEEWGVLWRAASALGQLGTSTTEEVRQTLLQALIELLKHSKAGIRQKAAYSLEKMGKKAATRETIQALRTTLQDEDSSVRSYAASVLGGWQKNWGLRVFATDNIRRNALATTHLGRGKHPLPIKIAPSDRSKLEAELEQVRQRQRELEGQLGTSIPEEPL